ncbi:MAG TPA: ATP-binding protein [Woeseiaceae bacterium]|nr:ATP-binding protein [Woeseiaceae bacterium]
MNLRRQLLLVSLLTLVLPWAGCQFVRETESALREGQQQMLAGTAQAIADSLAQFPAEFAPREGNAGRRGDLMDKTGDELYGHSLATAPLVDGYLDDWGLAPQSLVDLPEASASLAVGVYRQSVFLYMDVRDGNVVYSTPGSDRGRSADSIELVTVAEDGISPLTYIFTPEAPGNLVATLVADGNPDETRISAYWLDTVAGYRLEARVPRQLLRGRLGVVVNNTDNAGARAVRTRSFHGDLPGRLVTVSPLLQSVAAGYVQPDLRLTVLDVVGWRLAQVGEFASRDDAAPGIAAGWMRIAYDALLESGEETELADPDPSGREQQEYVQYALRGEMASSWFRNADGSRAVVAVAQPVWSGNVQTGAVILQQGTDAILSLRNRALTRLMNFTLMATLLVAAGLLGYASWLSLRIRRLSSAAERALDDKRVQPELPSAGASDEIGDLSRSFSSVLRRLGEYNEYLRTLASKLSHEMRTPLTIVTSSLENLEHEPLSAESAMYTERAREGTARLHRILNAMSEASRVEELIEQAETEVFDLNAVLSSTVTAYADAWPLRRFTYLSNASSAPMEGSPELIIQMLDKLVDNAVGFSADGDEIVIRLDREHSGFTLSVSNPGPPLPGRMRSQLFDSLVSVRSDDTGKHLGLGLFIARLVATGHGGSISARDVDGGAIFEVRLPAARDLK